MASTINALSTGSGGLVSTGDASGQLELQTNSTTRLTISSTGVISDAAGNIRAIPQSGSAKTTSYTLATSDVGQYIQVGSGGSITIPDAVFSTGDAIVIANNTTGNITITCTITTAYIAGTDTDKSTMTLATRGLANILFLSGTVCIVSGNVT